MLPVGTANTVIKEHENVKKRSTRIVTFVGLVAALIIPFAVRSAPAHVQDPDVGVLAPTINLTQISSHRTGVFDEGTAEIVAHDPQTQRLFIVNAQAATIDVLDVRNPAVPRKLFTIDVTAYGAVANSVDVANSIVAVAVENADPQAPGKVVFLNANGSLLGQVTVGALPDMVIWTPDGRKVLVANEGEPNDTYTVDPEGSISVIDVVRAASGTLTLNASTISFGSYNSQIASLRASGVRIIGPGATVAQDLEPEYIAVTPDGQSAYVTLQENNALAVINLATNTVSGIVPLGTKDHSVNGQGLDASEADGPGGQPRINIATWPVRGLFQPDGIATYERDGQVYLIMANEGEARDYDGFSEEAIVRDLQLDPGAFPNAASLKQDAALGTLLVTDQDGDIDDDGDYDVLYSFGGRSFSIRSINGALVFDSGDDFEQIVAAAYPRNFNNDPADPTDSRSDDKGPEPEGVVTGVVEERTYAFIGLERSSGIMVYDITDPAASSFVQYVNNVDFTGDPAADTAGDIAPEGLMFVSAAESPNDKPLLVVANEVSGSTSVYEISNSVRTTTQLFLPLVAK